jgi:hypothetical protein
MASPGSDSGVSHLDPGHARSPERGDGEPELLGDGGLLEPAAALVTAGGHRGEQAEVRRPAGREPLRANNPLERCERHDPRLRGKEVEQSVLGPPGRHGGPPGRTNRSCW